MGPPATTGGDMSILELINHKPLRKQLWAGIIVKIGVQFSGIDAISYYSTPRFRNAKVGPSRSA